MCGIAGFIERDVHPEVWGERLRAMAEALRHRGPDDGDVWCDAEAGVGLAHRRLAVIDLSPAGRQPMHSADGRWVIAYNGEVYNFEELRRDPALARRSWRGHSDTEVLLAAIDAWGVEGALRRFVGMFAFALVDRTARELWLARDRLGIKPLYYGTSGGAFVFGSELKALREHPGFDGGIDRRAVALLLRLGYIPAPLCIHREVRKLEPGAVLRVALDRPREAEPPRRFWSIGEVAARGQAQPFAGDERDALGELDRLLGQAVSRRLVSDVPVGAFLSGGVDSSLVVALMRRAATGPVRTFSIGFTEPGYDESGYARLVAAHLGTEHTERVVTAADAIAMIPELPRIWDEPFADPSQIPTRLVSAVARESVTVSLSGDGGDELFGGYKRYAATSELWSMMRRLPAAVRAGGAGWLAALPAGLLDSALGGLGPYFGRYGREGRTSDKLGKVAGLLPARDAAELYLAVISLWREPEAIVAGVEAADTLPPAGIRLDDDDLAHGMMLFDSEVYLPDDILTKLDRASMCHGLEARVPLLDHEVVEFVWTLPAAIRHGGRNDKPLLRQLLHRHVPPALVDRPKMGFGAPVGDWIRGPLRGWAESLLDEGRLSREGLLRPAPVRRRFREHLSGEREWGASLWAVLALQAWLAETPGVRP